MEAIAELWSTLKGWMTDLLHGVEGFAQHPSGEWALFGFAFAESSVFPIPPDVLLIPLCLGAPESAFRFAALCSLGSVPGGAAGYGLGLVGGRPLVRRLFSARRVEVVTSYWERHLDWLAIAFVILLIAGFLLLGRGVGRVGRTPAERE